MRAYRFCEDCGAYVGSAPFHSHSLDHVSPLSPFCVTCGKTLRVGFVNSVTCMCSPWVDWSSRAGEAEAERDALRMAGTDQTALNGCACGGLGRGVHGRTSCVVGGPYPPDTRKK